MTKIDKPAPREHYHELRLGIVAGCFAFPLGYLLAALIASSLYRAPLLPGVLAAMFFGVGGLIVGSMWGGRLDRASERYASRLYTKSSSTGREHSSW